jgi:putative flippase GtrA
MSGLTRWLRFNLVGAMGMAVQLSSLAVLSRVIPRHYVWASTVAVEMAVLHNFVWHVRFTWLDRRGQTSVRSQLRRFHFTNGAVSLLGNMALMRVLVGDAHVPVLVANLTASLFCATVNFYLGDTWAFAAER